MPFPRSSSRLIFACAGLCLLFASCSGRGEPRSGVAAPAAPVRSFEVRWFNASAAALLPAEKDPVALAIESRFSIKLTLLGGPPGSLAYQGLARDIENNLKLGPNDARRRTLPDVFPWAATLSGVPSLDGLFAPLPDDLIRRTMPRTWAGIRVLAAKEGMDPASVWAPFTSGGVAYAIPQPLPGWQFPAGVLWRADLLDQLGFSVPSTIDQWEAVFRAARIAYPSRVPWTTVEAGLPFQAIFDATGKDLAGFVRSGDSTLEPGLVQPQMRTVLQTLRRWYAEHYVSVIDSRAVGGDANAAFVSGRSIVTVDARPEDGSWVCQEPYVIGSIQDLTARRIPGAAFILGPRPVFAGVKTPGGPGRTAPFGALCFGFNRELVGEQAKLERIMSLVDTLAGDNRLYLTAVFGIEGKQWEWDRTPEGRYPRRLASAAPSNAGQYWIFPWTSYETQYALEPRVLDSITRSFGSPASLYGAGGDSRPLFRIPYADQGGRAVDEKRRFETLYTRIWSRFAEEVLYPVVYGTDDISAFDDFVAWYHDSGGEELARIVTRWADP